MQKITIYIDGGCKGNGSANARMYSSMAVLEDGVTRHLDTSSPDEYRGLAPHTNQHAELLALDSALAYLLNLEARMREKGMDPASLGTVEILTDSQLSANVLVWKIKEPHLLERRIDIMRHLGQLSAGKPVVTWVPREKIVAVLGH